MLNQRQYHCLYHMGITAWQLRASPDPGRFNVFKLNNKSTTAIYWLFDESMTWDQACDTLFNNINRALSTHSTFIGHLNIEQLSGTLIIVGAKCANAFLNEQRTLKQWLKAGIITLAHQRQATIIPDLQAMLNAAQLKASAWQQLITLGLGQS